MGPYSLPTLQQPGSTDTLSGWQVQPYQLNSAGNLPGTTTISINASQSTGVNISGPKQSITVGSITISGPKGYILFANPVSTINQMVEGTLPDGTTGLVASVQGVDVLSIFN